MDVKTPGIKLYRFQPYCDANKNLQAERILHDQLWLSSRERFNDPQDAHHEVEDFTYDANGKSSTLKSLAKVAYCDDKAPFLDFNVVKTFVDADLLNRIRDWVGCDENTIDICDAYRARFGRIGIACFTPNWNCPPMWAHYAQNWQGFLLEYQVNSIELATSGDVNVSFAWVRYVERVEQSTLSEFLFSPYETAKRYLSTKSLPWSYEQEWRLVNFARANSNVPLPAGMDLTKIIVGPKSSGDQTRCLVDKAKNWNVAIERLHIGRNRTLGLVSV